MTLVSEDSPTLTYVRTSNSLGHMCSTACSAFYMYMYTCRDCSIEVRLEWSKTVIRCKNHTAR